MKSGRSIDSAMFESEVPGSSALKHADDLSAKCSKSVKTKSGRSGNAVMIAEKSARKLFSVRSCNRSPVRTMQAGEGMAESDDVLWKSMVMGEERQSLLLADFSESSRMSFSLPLAAAKRHGLRICLCLV